MRIGLIKKKGVWDIMRDVNFIPTRYKVIPIIKGLLEVIIVLLIITSIYTFSGQRSEKSIDGEQLVRIDQIEQEIRQIKDEQGKIEKILSESFIYTKMGGDLYNLPVVDTEDTISIKDFLTYLASISGEDIHITSIYYSENKIQLVGQAKEYTSLIGLINRVEQDGILHKVELKSVEPVLKENVAVFELECKVIESGVDKQRADIVIKDNK